MAKNRILILGAGYAGIHAAKKLAKKYKKNQDVEITLIDKNPFHTLMTELHEVAGGRVEPESVQVDLSKIFARTKVKLVIDYIENVDMDNNIVTTKHGKYDYTHLIIGTGSEPAFFGIPGVKENGFTLWSFEDALRIREHIQNMFELASKERDAAKRKALLTFVVAGSGFTGIEMAGELLEWKKKLAKIHNVDEREVQLYVVEAMGTILNMLDRKQADKAERYMLRHGMKVLKNSPIVEVTEDKISLKSGQTIPTNTLIWTCGIQCNQEIKEYGLDTGRADRILTNEYMEAKDRKNVYIVGDATCYEEKPGQLTPQIVEAAEQTAMTAAKNIIASIDNKEKVKFKSNYHGFMVSIGGKYGVAHVGGMKLSGFFAILMKHLVNLYYLWGVNNINACYHYLQHEFFHMKDERSIMRGHLASKGNRLWLIPLRLYIGVLWVLEGLKKFVGDTAWNKDGLKSIFDGIGPDSWMRAGNVKMPFSWLYASANGTTDAVGSASTAAAGTATAATNVADAVGGASAVANAATNAADTVASASTATGETATHYATPIIAKMPKFYEAIMQVMIPTADMAVWFQRMVVLIEIGIGLALIVGLFTFLASAASAFMVCNFVLSAMAGWDILWYFFGAIALMSGAGRTFGLDYYVIPWINKLVGNWWLGTKTPIYRQK